MSSKIDTDIKKQLKYDKLNTKYNRLWEQLTNFFLFFFASLIAYSVLFVEYKMNNLTALFLSNAMLPLIYLTEPL